MYSVHYKYLPSKSSALKVVCPQSRLPSKSWAQCRCPQCRLPSMSHRGFRSYADLKLLWGPNSRVTCWVSSATRLSVTSCNAANASTLRWTLRHTPLNLKVTVSIPDIAICIAVHSMNASLSQGNNSCSLLTKCKCKG